MGGSGDRVGGRALKVILPCTTARDSLSGGRRIGRAAWQRQETWITERLVCKEGHAAREEQEISWKYRLMGVLLPSGQNWEPLKVLFE
jgi:hypothetical protein